MAKETKTTSNLPNGAGVRHLGGIFIYSNNAAQLAERYRTHLGINYEYTEGYGAYYAPFYYHETESNKKAYALWSILQAKGDTPAINGKVFCVNYRVQDIEATVAHLQSLGVEVKPIETHEQGKFAWCNDPEGNVVELWEDTTIG